MPQPGIAQLPISPVARTPREVWAKLDLDAVDDLAGLLIVGAASRSRPGRAAFDPEMIKIEWRAGNGSI